MSGDRLVRVKLLYSFDDASRQFVAKPSNKLPGAIDDATGVGLVELRACLTAILATSPELVSSTDYTVYTVDYSEPGEPLQGHGRLSTLREASEPMAIGRMSKSPLFPDLLTIKFRFAPLCASPAHQSPQPVMAPVTAPMTTPMTAPMSAPVAARSHASMPLPYVTKAFPKAKSTWSVRSPPTIALSPSDLEEIASRRAAVIKPVTETRVRKRRGKYQMDDPATYGYCRNCGCTETSSWRPARIPDPDSGVEKVVPLCNACGLWYRNKGFMRPRDKWARYKSSNISSDFSRSDPINSDPLSSGSIRSMQSDPIRSDSIQSDPTRSDPIRSDPLQSDPLQSDSLRSDAIDIFSKRANRLPSSPPALGVSSSPPAALASSPPVSKTAEPSTPVRVAGKENVQPTTPGSLDRLFWGDEHQGKTPTPGGSRWMLRYFHGDPSDHAKMLEPFLDSPCKKRTGHQESPTSSSPPRGNSSAYNDISSDWTVLPTSPTLGVKRRATGR